MINIYDDKHKARGEEAMARRARMKVSEWNELHTIMNNEHNLFSIIIIIGLKGRKGI